MNSKVLALSMLGSLLFVSTGSLEPRASHAQPSNTVRRLPITSPDSAGRTRILTRTFASDSETAPVEMSEENITQTEDRLKEMEAEILKQLEAGSSQPVAKKVSRPQPAKLATATASRIRPVKEIAPPIAEEEGEESEEEIEDEDRETAALRSRSNRHNLVDHSDIEQKLLIAESQVKILTQELETTKRSLRVAERRIDELSNLVKNAYRVSQAPRIPDVLSSEELNDMIDEDEPPRIQNDELVETDSYQPAELIAPLRPEPRGGVSKYMAYVNLQKAPLRTGPSRLDSALFLLPKNSAVRVERRMGDWYRVITASGTRGWIYAGAVLFGSSPTSTVRVRGYRADLQDGEYS